MPLVGQCRAIHPPNRHRPRPCPPASPLAASTPKLAGLSFSWSPGIGGGEHRVRMFVPRAGNHPGASSDAGENGSRRHCWSGAVLLASLICTSVVSSGCRTVVPDPSGSQSAGAPCGTFGRDRTTGSTWNGHGNRPRSDVPWFLAVAGAGSHPRYARHYGSRSEVGPERTLHRGAAGVWLGFRIVGSTITVTLARSVAFRGLPDPQARGRRCSKLGPRPLSRGCLRRVLRGVRPAPAAGLAGHAGGMTYAVALYRRGRVGKRCMPT